MERLKKIYQGLEYNTASFNDLKRTWIVTDPVFVREIFNKFVVKNALRVNGKKPRLAVLEENAKRIYDGEVFIDLRKRYYDDEIEVLRFFKESRHVDEDTSDYFFDAVNDFVFIKEICGDELYADLKKQGYALNDITKTFFDYKPAYNFIAYFSLTDPELMFWNTTTNKRNKYFLSAIGRWGNDHIAIPGWYHPEYVVGLKLNYVDSLENNKEGYTYIGEIGLGLPSVQPDLGFDNSFSGRRLEHSGTSFYLKFVGKPLGALTPELASTEINLTALFTIGTKKAQDFEETSPKYFYSTRNYFDLFFKWNNLGRVSDFGSVNAGFGVSGFDLDYYYFDPSVPSLNMPKNQYTNGFKYAIVAEGNLANTGSILSHSFGLQLSYNATEQLMFFGVKANIMISNSIGLDFKVLSPIQTGSKLRPDYRPDSYLVLSPIIKINY
ncbi:MAG: hypothetical protein LWX56_08195 [Ignavibacteria bacterium]|nr:hypothetical protein [Ignavibacteria bacterium]